mgnify:CR=1 FL=1
MQRLQVTNAKTMAILIQAEIQINDESRYNHRLHGVLLVAKGHSCSTVADFLGHSVKTIENWVNRFNEEGFQALRDEQRTGRPPSLSDQQLKEIKQILRKDPIALGYEQNMWDGKLLSYHMNKKYGISLSVRQCQRLFHKLDFRQIKPRPISSKSDPKKQSSFKKTKTEI